MRHGAGRFHLRANFHYFWKLFAPHAKIGLGKGPGRRREANLQHVYFRDVIGQTNVKRSLLTMAGEGRVPHAMMFLGEEGRGSLPLALAFAQYIDCTGDKSGGEPCGECPACRKIAKLVHPDLHFVFPIAKSSSGDDTDSFLPAWREMVVSTPYFGMTEWNAAMSSRKSAPASGDEPDDKKATTGKQALIAKDAAETIHQKLSMKPYESERQIMIIYKPELMNDTTSNSLLKILEEPPVDTMFILVSEDSQRILPTILSRAQTFRVPPIAEDDMAAALAQRQGLDPDTAARLAHIAQGNYVMALRQLSASAETKENLEFFKETMRAAWKRDVVKMNTLAEACKGLSREQAKGRLIYCQHMIRESFIMNLGVGTLNFLTADEEAFLANFAPFVHVANVDRLSALFDDCIAKVEQNGSVRMIMKVAILQLTALIRTVKRPRPDVGTA